jgi:HEAT repeat protein
LTAWLTDEDLGVRSNVASALGELAQRNSGAFTPEIVQGLITLLQNEDSAAQSGAASVLGILAQEKPEIIQGLFRLLENDQSSIARNGASEALFVADVKDTRQKDFIEDELEKLVKSPQPHLRAAASQTLEMIVVGGLIHDAHAHPDQLDLIRARLNGLKSLDESLHEKHLRFAAQIVLDEIDKIRSANK